MSVVDEDEPAQLRLITRAPRSTAHVIPLAMFESVAPESEPICTGMTRAAGAVAGVPSAVVQREPDHTGYIRAVVSG